MRREARTLRSDWTYGLESEQDADSGRGGVRDGHPVSDSGAHRLNVMAAAAVPLVLLVSAGVIALVLIGSFEAPGGWDVLATETYLERLSFTIAQAAAAMIVGVVLGLPASWLLSRGGLPAGWLLAFLIVGPIAVPAVVVGLGADLIAQGEIAPRALVIASNAIFATSAFVWIVTPAWDADSVQAGEDARLLGAGRVRAYLVGPGRRLPAAIRGGAALAFFYAFVTVGAVAIVGGVSGATTESGLAFGVPVAAMRPPLDDALIAERSAVAVVQLAIGLLVIALGGVRWPRTSVARGRASGPVLALGMLYLLALGGVLWAPLGAVVTEAVSEGSIADLWSLEVGGSAVPTLFGWTALLGGLSATLATLLAWMASGLLAEGHRSRRDALGRWLVAVPAAGTGAAIAWAGLVLAESTVVDVERTYALTVVAHALIAYPFALRILGTRGSARPELTEDMLVLGVSMRAARWRWSGRRTLMTLVGAFLVSLIFSASEVAAATLLTPVEATPAAVGILRGWTEMERPAVYAVGAALAGATVIAFALAEWLRRAAARVEVG